ncbi:helix-turn-helix domain-containing protein [Bacillus sonorensis]|uniref:helix-turn-helix domain-containing protein n=1 Tax=Bacillus TaxID=1386 RepID=UPI0028533087|nr:helix-turn-helix domain-containing protein [Bacillus sonorensis]MDR4956804.1 helix-turn-helix domain-containing protein [Bacillus sonorensis]
MLFKISFSAHVLHADGQQADYIRKRRLTVAAQKLAATDAKVVDIALKYGCHTPESFSKAFSNLHGMSLSQARV